MLRFVLMLLIQFVWMVGASAQAQAKDTIKLFNPSFEDQPRNSQPPKGWYDCGFANETPPDVQPNGGFEVTKTAQQGSTFLGLVVRDNETWEAVAQRLNKPLRSGKCYEFSIHLSRSEIYVSQSRTTNTTANYVTPAKMRIYGGNSYCAKSEMLGETSLVINTRWLEYKFRFEPSSNYSFITLEAFYNTPTLFPYNGNVLVDNASHIVEISCTEPVAEEPVAETKPPVNKKPTPQPQKENTPTQEPEKILKELDSKTIREGQTIRIDKLFFNMDSYTIKAESSTVLDEIYDFMMANPNVVVEIGGHTNTIPDHEYCDKLSTNRAKAVADYLVAKGISAKRLLYKGYGKRNPITLDTSQDGRRKNQRVEIKILSING